MIAKFLLISLSLSSAFTAKESKAVPALRLRGGSLTPNAAAATYFGVFGAGLYIAPDTMFGDNALLSYVNDVEGPVGAFYARGFGGMMMGMAAACILEPASTALTSLYAISMTLFTPLLANNLKRAMSGDKSGFKKKMWIPQALVHIPFTVFMLAKAFM